MTTIIFGIVLIVLQIASYIGNIATGGLYFFANVNSFGQFVSDLIYFLSYNLVGIVGLVLLITGIIKLQKPSNKQPRSDESTQKWKLNFKENSLRILTKLKSFFKKMFFFFERNIKFIIFFTSVCAFLCIVSLVIYNVCASNMRDAYYHYERTQEKYSVGCGEYYCPYCEGDVLFCNNNYSPYSFRYYRKTSDIRTVFEGIGVISLIMTIVSSALLIGCLIHKKNKLKPHKNEQLQLPSPPNDANLEIKFCKYCGKQIDTDSVFCSCCGKNITKSKEEN